MIVIGGLLERKRKLRIKGKLTNCETGDSIVLFKSSTLQEHLHRFMSFGQFKAKVIHRGQVKPVQNCTKCLENGHIANACKNDWKCVQCKATGHRKGDCPLNDVSSSETEGETPQDTSDDEETSTKSRPTQNNNNNKNTRAKRGTPAQKRTSKQTDTSTDKSTAKKNKSKPQQNHVK